MKHVRLSDEALMAILIASLTVFAVAGIAFWFRFIAKAVISAVAFVTEYQLPIPWPFLIVLGSVLLSIGAPVLIGALLWKGHREGLL